jgi:hypothetical protein
MLKYMAVSNGKPISGILHDYATLAAMEAWMYDGRATWVKVTVEKERDNNEPI